MSKIVEGLRAWLGNSRPDPMEPHRPSEVLSKPANLAIASHVPGEDAVSTGIFFFLFSGLRSSFFGSEAAPFIVEFSTVPGHLLRRRDSVGATTARR